MKQVLVLVVLLHVSWALSNGTTPKNNTEKECTSTAAPCVNGLLLPAWRPVGNLSGGDKAARAIVYFSSLIFMFLGVSIIADRFMAAIEVITSKEKIVTIKKPNGDVTTVSVKIWNETVSNLTLMALGSSAPEILLSIIEIGKNNFNAGELGPGTIVGSAAFNLFVIIAICVYVIPDGEVRRIKHLRVFFITASWSIFAYLWLYLIIAVSSEGVVTILEALLTFLFFPATVITAYIADKRIFFGTFLSNRRYRATKKSVVTDGDVEMADGKANHYNDEVEFKGSGEESGEVAEFEKHRREYMDIMRELRKKNPNMDMHTLEEMAQLEIMNRGPKSRAFYRIQATRKLTGGGNVIKKSKIERRSSVPDVKEEEEDDSIIRIFFEPGHYTVMENIGTFNVTVSRSGGDEQATVYVDYKTEDGTANAGSDYIYAEGTLVFHCGEMHKQFSLTILDDDVFEEDEHFYVRLSNLRVSEPDGTLTDNTDGIAELTTPSLATVMILDDDHAGIYHFESPEVNVIESIGEGEFKVIRSSGARGRVKIPYRTIDGTAKTNKDYIGVEDDYLIFENDETEKIIKIRIIDDEEYEKKETFYIELGDPILLRRGSKQSGKIVLDDDQPEEPMDANDLGRPVLGTTVRLEVTITESMEFKNTVDKLLKKANLSLVVGTSSWREQFIEAITVSAGDEEEDEDGEEKLPSCMDYVMHFLTIFWKVLFACVPPTDYWNGWACFVSSIMFIGLLTAVIGDLASHFGCTIGLKDAVTAITFVALGTSVPDTFASKVAAVGDSYADSSIGNVTGSNAVNVFLGIGVAWMMASLYHLIKPEANPTGKGFEVEPGSLGFSVTIFVIFAVLAIIVILIRRSKRIGGELGGPKVPKIVTAIFLVSLWFSYVLLCSLESYCHIKGF